MRWLCFAVVLAACDGQISGPGTRSPESPLLPGQSGAGGGDGVDVDPLDARCTDELNAGWGPLRRVTHEEYSASVKLLVGQTFDALGEFPQQAKANGFTNASAQQTVGELQVEAYFDAAEELAAEAVKTLPALLQCDTAAQGEVTCGQQFIDRFGARAFRRPLTTDERDGYRQLLTVATSRLDFKTGIEVVVTAMLQSPHFLYHVERGAEVKPGLVKLDGHTVAARLATALWQSLPDDALLAAASSGGLDDAAGVEAQARRMVNDEKARPVLTRMYVELTRADELGKVPKDATLYPAWEDLRHSMSDETSRFVTSVLFDGDAKVSTLFTAPYTFVDERLATHYGVTSASGWQKVSLENTQRLGLLTQGGVLAVNAKTNQSSPTLRGLFVRENLLCDPPPPPPADANIVPPDIQPGVPTRQRYAEHATNASCSGCHTKMDPIGLGFEHFDAIGGWRDKDEGIDVDATGEVYGTDAAGKFDGAKELALRLSTSHDVASCLGSQAFRFFTARHESDGDTCTLHRLDKQFASTGYDLKELVVSLTASDSFRHRKVDP